LVAGNEHRTAERDRTIGLFVFALCLSALSYLFSAFSVHTYCEGRLFGVGLAFAVAVAIYLLICHRPPNAWRRAIAALAILLCLLVVTFNGWYFIWVTRTCAAQERLK
jgi:hypothetical protein